MKIKEILDQISSESSSNRKIEILTQYRDNKTLEKVLYLTYSNRVKFYIRQIPEYNYNGDLMPLAWAIEKLEDVYNREVTGNAAIDYLTWVLSSVSSDDAYVIERIIDKDLKIGLARASINKVFPKLIEKTP